MTQPTRQGGCARHWGVLPRHERLGTLRPGVSSESDVLLALGEPRGQGVMRWTAALEPRRVWYYEYVAYAAMGPHALDPSILLVFFKQDRYDGYMWFSTAKLLKSQ